MFLKYGETEEIVYLPLSDMTPLNEESVKESHDFFEKVKSGEYKAVLMTESDLVQDGCY